MDPNESTAVPEATIVSPNVTGDPPAPEDDADPDTLAVEVERPGGKVAMVPLPALKQARDKLKSTRDEIKTARDEAAALRQQIDAVAPVMQLLQANPALLQQVQQGQVPTRTEPTEDDRDAYEAAQIYQLYNHLGQPDVVAGRKMLELQDRRMQRQLQPVQQETAQQRAQTNYERALAARDEDGRPYARPETIRAVYQMVPPKLAADPQVAQLLLDVARGKDAKHIFGQPQPPSHPPLFSEAPGGRMPMDEGLTPEEQRVARNLGVSEKEWKASTTNRAGGLWAPFKE